MGPDSYQEIFGGEVWIRPSPARRHEAICIHLHTLLSKAIESSATTRILASRSIVPISSGNLIRPDLALVTAATGRIWLAAEVIDSVDHRTDTVSKKQIYEEANIPRLWIVDPRYDNVEVYHASEYGLSLKSILAGKELLADPLLPGFRTAVADLFSV